jgi:hypothetical protein
MQLWLEASCVMALPTETCSAIHRNTSVHSYWRRFEKRMHHVNQMNGSTVPANAELLAME